MGASVADRVAYRVPEVAYRCGISRAQLYVEIKAGRLRVVKVGRATLIREVDLQDWLDAHTLGAPAEES